MESQLIHNLKATGEEVRKVTSQMNYEKLKLEKLETELIDKDRKIT